MKLSQTGKLPEKITGDPEDYERIRALRHGFNECLDQISQIDIDVVKLVEIDFDKLEQIITENNKGDDKFHKAHNIAKALTQRKSEWMKEKK